MEIVSQPSLVPKKIVQKTLKRHFVPATIVLGSTPLMFPPCDRFSEELRENGAGSGKAEFAHLLLVFCRSSELFCSRGLFLPVLVSLTCWHLLGASLSHWADSSHSACHEIEKDVLPLASWQEPAVRAAAGMRRRLCTDAPAHPNSSSAPSFLWSDVTALKRAADITR